MTMTPCRFAWSCSPLLLALGTVATLVVSECCHLLLSTETTGQTFAGQVENASDTAFLDAACDVVLASCTVFGILSLSTTRRRHDTKCTTKPLQHECKHHCKQRPKEAGQPHASQQKNNADVLAEAVASAAERARLTEVVCSYAKRNKLEEACEALDRLDSLGLPAPEAYKAVITLCAKSDDANRAFKLLRRAEECSSSNAQDAVCYNAVTNLFAKRGDMERAVDIASSMLRVGVRLDTVSYNTLIDGYARVGDAHGAERWMQSMLDQGVKASVVSFASVMRACAHAGFTEKVQHWFQEADRLGIELNMICFSSIINAFAKAGDIDSTTIWFTHMLDRGVTASIKCFQGILDAVLKTEDLEQAAVLVEKMRTANVCLDSGIYNSLVLAAANKEDLKWLQHWTDEAMADGIRLPKAARTAASSLPGWKFHGDVVAQRCQSRPAQLAKKPEVIVDVNQAQAKALVGKRLVGTIKEFISCRFGYVVCRETYAVFGRDIFLGSSDNPEGFAKGQRVWFTLQIDRRRNLPRATSLAVCCGAADPVSSVVKEQS